MEVRMSGVLAITSRYVIATHGITAIRLELDYSRSPSTHCFVYIDRAGQNRERVRVPQSIVGAEESLRLQIENSLWGRLRYLGPFTFDLAEPIRCAELVYDEDRERFIVIVTMMNYRKEKLWHRTEEEARATLNHVSGLILDQDEEDEEGYA